jgi:hypothetical protein
MLILIVVGALAVDLSSVKLAIYAGIQKFTGSDGIVYRPD